MTIARADPKLMPALTVSLFLLIGGLLAGVGDGAVVDPVPSSEAVQTLTPQDDQPIRSACSVCHSAASSFPHTCTGPSCTSPARPGMGTGHRADGGCAPDEPSRDTIPPLKP